LYIILESVFQSETRDIVSVDGVLRSGKTSELLCWLEQLVLKVTGVTKLVVGVNPVEQAMRLSKPKLVIHLEGVSMTTPSTEVTGIWALTFKVKGLLGLGLVLVIGSCST